MLRTLDQSQKADWKSHLADLVHAYNCSRHHSTGYSPYFLLFGQEPKLPVDVTFGLAPAISGQKLNEFVETRKSELKQAYDSANKANRASSAKNEEYH